MVILSLSIFERNKSKKAQTKKMYKYKSFKLQAVKKLML